MFSSGSERMTNHKATQMVPFERGLRVVQGTRIGWCGPSWSGPISFLAREKSLQGPWWGEMVSEGLSLCVCMCESLCLCHFYTEPLCHLYHLHGNSFCRDVHEYVSVQWPCALIPRGSWREE